MTGQRSYFLQSVCKSRSANKVQNRKESLKGTGAQLFLKESDSVCWCCTTCLKLAVGMAFHQRQTTTQTTKKNRNSAIQVSEKMAF